MSAVIIPLPGAAAAPVVQPKRRGRVPGVVTGIWQARARRAARGVAAPLTADELEAKARDYRSTVASMRDSISYALGEAAAMEARARALRGPAR